MKFLFSTIIKLSFLLFIAMPSLQAATEVYYVGPDGSGDFSGSDEDNLIELDEVRKLFDDADTSTAHVWKLTAGDYSVASGKEIRVNKSLKIVGQGETSVIDCGSVSSFGDRCIDVDFDVDDEATAKAEFKIENLVLKHGFAGIQINDNGGSMTVKGVTFAEGYFGIVARGDTPLSVFGSTFDQQEVDGIWLDKEGSIEKIKECTFNQVHEKAIHIEEANQNGVLISRNQFFGDATDTRDIASSHQGIVFSGSLANNTIIRGNLFEDMGTSIDILAAASNEDLKIVANQFNRNRYYAVMVNNEIDLLQANSFIDIGYSAALLVSVEGVVNILNNIFDQKGADDFGEAQSLNVTGNAKIAFNTFYGGNAEADLSWPIGLSEGSGLETPEVMMVNNVFSDFDLGVYSRNAGRTFLSENIFNNIAFGNYYAEGLAVIEDNGDNHDVNPGLEDPDNNEFCPASESSQAYQKGSSAYIGHEIDDIQFLRLDIVNHQDYYFKGIKSFSERENYTLGACEEPKA